MVETEQFDDFFANDPEDTRCVQACYQMIVSRLRGERVTMAAAEKETGYHPDLLTWQFAMLYSLAEVHGLYVVDHEAFSVERFIDSPEKEIKLQIQDSEAAQYQIDNTNLPLERDQAERCLNHPRITFIDSNPTYEELVSLSSQGAVIVVVINGAILTGDSGYRPHSVIIREANESTLIVDDPGPPPAPRLVVPRAQFEAAWCDPSPSVTNLVAYSTSELKFK